MNIRYMGVIRNQTLLIDLETRFIANNHHSLLHNFLQFWSPTSPPQNIYFKKKKKPTTS